MNVNDVITESHHACPHCGGPLVEYSDLMEKKDACYYKVKASAKVWPSAYASGRLVQCRKKGASNYGNKSESVNEGVNPDCFDPAFNDTQHFDGLTYRATVDEEYGKPVLTIKVLDDNFQQAGLAKFKPSKAGVVSLITSFRPEYQGQGLARNIYAYVRAMGNTIVPSRNQLPAGRAMWDSWKKSGDAKHLMRDVAEGLQSHDFMAGHCHVMALALKQLHPDWQIRAHVGWDDDATDDAEYRVDHVYTVAPDGTAYDCRGRFDNEEQLVGPDATGGVDTQYVNFGPEEIKQAMLRGELKRFSKQDLDNAMQVVKQDGDTAMTENQDELARILELGGVQLTEQLTADQQFDIIEEMVEQLAESHGVDAEQIWEDFESVDDHELFETAAWRRSAGKSKKGGLNAKGVASYRRENPGSKLQMAVTTKPSKLKPGSKAAKRRKSFCARMGGVKGPMKKPNGKPTRKALALRKWNC